MILQVRADLDVFLYGEHMRTRRRTVAVIVTAAAIAAVGVVTAVSAQAATGCRVDYAVTNQWQGGFGANVTLTNLGDAVSSWRLTWTFGAGQTVTQLWNAAATRSGDQLIVTNTTWNGSLAPGATATFGFLADGDGVVPPTVTGCATA